MSFSTLLKISRPRFWHYVLGPMLIYFASSGYFINLQGLYNEGSFYFIATNLLLLIIILGYFTLPANLWIYGWNDIADGDTDKFNSKKGTYESRIENTNTMKNKLKWNIWGWNILYIIIGCLIFGYLSWSYDYNNNQLSYSLIEYSVQYIIKSLVILLPFYLTSYFYSCGPLRAKAKPFIDGLMNVLYIATPFSIILLENQRKSRPISNTIITYNLFAALFRCMAMHCYSAIPDIEPDHQAGLNTTAVYLGKQNSLIYCAVLYLLSALLSFPTLGWFNIVGGIIYISMMILSYYKKDVFALYKLFPYINLIIGFLLFRYIILYL